MGWHHGNRFGGGRPKFFRKRKERHHGALAEREEAPAVPSLPERELPATYAACCFGRLDARLQHAIADMGYTVPTPV